MGGGMTPSIVFFKKNTSSNYGEQYNQIQGSSKYFHIQSSLNNKLASVNCEFKENPELRVPIKKSGFKCNDYMIVGYWIKSFNSLRYSLFPLERVPTKREMYSINIKIHLSNGRLLYKNSGRKARILKLIFECKPTDDLVICILLCLPKTYTYTFFVIKIMINNHLSLLYNIDD